MLIPDVVFPDIFDPQLVIIKPLNAEPMIWLENSKMHLENQLQNMCSNPDVSDVTEKTPIHILK